MKTKKCCQENLIMKRNLQRRLWLDFLHNKKVLCYKNGGFSNVRESVHDQELPQTTIIGLLYGDWLEGLGSCDV